MENELPKVSTEHVEKARELYELGNSRYKIRMILMETEKISSEEVDEIMYVAFQEEDKKNQRQNRTVLIIGGILILLCLCSVIAVSVFRRVSSTVSPSIEDIGQPPVADQDPSNQNQPEEDDGINIPFLPDSVEQLMPLLSGEPPDFPEPQVQQGAPTGNQVYTCPTDSTTAANLLGISRQLDHDNSPLSWHISPSAQQLSTSSWINW